MNEVRWLEEQRLAIFNFCFLEQSDKLLWNFSNKFFPNLTYEKNILMENTWNIVLNTLCYLNKIHGKHHLHHNHILQQMQIYTGNSILFCSIVFWRTYWNRKSKTLFLRILADVVLNLYCKFPAFLWPSQSVFFCCLNTISIKQLPTQDL